MKRKIVEVEDYGKGIPEATETGTGTGIGIAFKGKLKYGELIKNDRI